MKFPVYFCGDGKNQSFASSKLAVNRSGDDHDPGIVGRDNPINGFRSFNNRVEAITWSYSANE